MNQNQMKRMSSCLMCLVIASVILLAGCSERVNRENVFANTETGFGIFIQQNPKTQVYEGKLGYFRHELFYVPTSKTITYKDKREVMGVMEWIFGPPLVEQDVENASPSETPEVLAEIVADGVMPNPQNATNNVTFGVRQKLAVGKEAVKSASALALMADTDEEARAASGLIGQNIKTEDIRIAYDAMAIAWNGLRGSSDNKAKQHASKLNLLKDYFLRGDRSAKLTHAYTFNSNVLTERTLPPINTGDFREVTTSLNHWRNNITAYKKAKQSIDAGNTLQVQKAGVAAPTALNNNDINQFLKSNVAIYDEFDKEVRSNKDVIAAMQYYAKLLGFE